MYNTSDCDVLVDPVVSIVWVGLLVAPLFLVLDFVCELIGMGCCAKLILMLFSMF